jgi:AAA15 family ATPase/GTPase
MKITKFQVKNYQSIKDTGVIELSENDNLSIFAGQNESGKSSILKALNAFRTERIFWG